MKQNKQLTSMRIQIHENNICLSPGPYEFSIIVMSTNIVLQNLITKAQVEIS